MSKKIQLCDICKLTKAAEVHQPSKDHKWHYYVHKGFWGKVGDVVGTALGEYMFGGNR